MFMLSMTWVTLNHRKPPTFHIFVVGEHRDFKFVLHVE